MGEMAQTFISEIEGLTLIKCRAVAKQVCQQQYNVVPYGTEVLSKRILDGHASLTEVKFTTYLLQEKH